MPRDWRSLSAGSKRRWTAAYGGNRKTLTPHERERNARYAYEAGEHLTTEQRGHARTPNRPEDALRHPERYPAYLSKSENLQMVNTLARLSGEGQVVGRGRRGVVADQERAARGVRDPGGYTYVIDSEDFADRSFPGDWSRAGSYKYKGQAQRRARASGAPPGMVVVVDRGPRPADFPKGQTWERYVLWYDREVSPKAAPKRERKAA